MNIKLNNYMRMTFPSLSQNESLARMAVTAFLSTANPTVDELCAIKTAVSEAVTNCIVHGYAESEGRIGITAKISAKKVLTVTIEDKGCGIADIEQARVPLFTTCTTGERAGLGFAIMEELCDGVAVKSQVGKGTRITLTLKLSVNT